MRGYRIKKSLYTFIILIGFWFDHSAAEQHGENFKIQLHPDQSQDLREETNNEALSSYLKSSSGVSLVFASQYTGNPASIMGHTFLKFNDPKISDNLLPSINYGANVDPNVNAVKYVISGLFGGFMGQYGLESYFQKKKEYRDIENRDLWEYEIDLSPEELEILKHNLSQDFSKKDRKYFFLDNNCSFEILRQIEIAKKDFTFTNQDYLFVLPQETIRWLDNKKYIKNRTLKPALRNQMLSRYDELNSASKVKVLNAWQKKEIKNEISAKELDVLILRLQMEEYRLEEKPPQNLIDFGNRILLLRSNLHSFSEHSKENFNKPDPAESHLPHLIKVDNSENKIEIFLSPGIHHLSQDPSGFLPNTEMSFLGTKIGIDKSTSRKYINEFNLVTMSSWTEYSRIDPKFAWRVKVFDVREELARSAHARSQRMEFATGVGFKLAKLKTSILMGGVLTHGSARGTLDGSRIQIRLVASYLKDRKWMSLVELYNTSRQVDSYFKNAFELHANLWALKVANSLDLSVGYSIEKIESLADRPYGKVSVQYSF